MLKQQLEQKLQQRLSPQQVMLARLLETTAVEMEDVIKKNLEDNPALEEGGEDDSYTQTEDYSENDTMVEKETSEDMILGDYMNEDEIPDYRLQTNNHSKDDAKESSVLFTESTSIFDSLNEQLSNRDLTDEQIQLGKYIIGNIDSDGYLRRSLSQLMDDLAFTEEKETTIEKLQQILDIIQEFDPPGIAARDLQECLINQIERLVYTPARDTAYRILKDCFTDFCDKRYERILTQLSITEEEMNEAIAAITKLNPKPTNGFNEGGGSEKVMQIIPDFNVELMDDGQLHVSLINSRIPELRVSRSYTEMLEDFSATEKNRSLEKRNAVSYIHQKLDAAMGFIQAIQQRQKTLLAVMLAITQIQRDFFISGGDFDQLHPMKLQDVADIAGYDISTVSRVTNNKYVQAPYGIYALKSFFKEALQNDKGETISYKQIGQLLSATIEKEDRNNPLNDIQLAEILKEKGMTMARRTIAKYRQELNIPTSKARKELYKLKKNQ